MERSLKLFVNYRRADNPHFVENIRTWLMIRYGRENVFMDFDSLPNFAQFEDFIKQKIRESDVVISIIGPQWLDLLADRAQRGDKDYVRLELEEALKHQKLVAPILILGANPPPQGRLPDTLRPIFDTWNAARLRDGKEVIEKIHPLMDDLERLLADQGVQFTVQSQPSELARDNSATAGGLDVYAAYGRMLAAFRGEEWDVVLGWVAELINSGQDIPPMIADDVSEIETISRQRQAELAEQQRRQQVADYLYGFVKVRFEAGFKDDKTRRLLGQVWEVLADYDPAGIAPQLVATPPKAEPKPAAPPAPAPAPKIEVKETPPAPKVKVPPAPRMLPGPFEWCHVPGGDVTLEAGGYVPEGGQTFTVAPFYIAKYAITNAQFKVFVKAQDGYRNAGWWDFSAEAKGWRAENKQPRKTGFAGDTLPRTEVTWYESMAFCRWLSAQTGDNITLPTEQQWQFAAQGTDKRTYPWGNQDPTPELANYGGHVGKPTPVDSYPSGASPYGALNMAGNVWDWCVTGYETGDQSGNKNDKYRVLRGGAWDNPYDDYLRAARRFGSDPNSRLSGRGFRLARS